MKKKQIKLFVFVFCFLAVGVFINVLYRYDFYKAETELPYCKKIAREINYIGTSQFYCKNIEEGKDSIIFWLSSQQTYPEYSLDGGIEDVIKIKSYLIEYMGKYPENELNGKKIRLIFYCNNNVEFAVYNYNYLTGEFKDSKDFSYFEKIFVEHMSAIEGLGNVSIISLLSVRYMDFYDFLQDWDNLQYIRIYTTDITEEEKQKIEEMLPDNCDVNID